MQKSLVLAASLALSLALGPAVAHTPVTNTNQAIGLPIVGSTTTEGSHVFTTKTSWLYTITTTIGATTGYLMLFDATTVPSDGAVTPLYCYPVVSNGTLGGTPLGWAPGPPAKFNNGIVAVFSSTGCGIKTASATAYFFAQVE